MGFTIAGIKQYLSLFGLKDISVKFESAAQLIHVNFIYGGQHQTKTIPFQDIEQLFSDTDSTPIASAQADNFDRGGTHI